MNDNEQRVKTRELSWKDLVQKAWGKDWNKNEVVYEFGERKFESTDKTSSGIYEDQ